MLQINLRPHEPLPSAHHPPHQHRCHRRSVDQHRPVHRLVVQIPAPRAREAHNRRHEHHERAADPADRHRESSEIPRPRPEAVTDEEEPDEDWNCEGDVLCYGADREQGADGQLAAEDEEEQEQSDEVVDEDGVDGSAGHVIDFLPDRRKGETVVAGVGERDAGGGDHARLAHAEPGDDCERQYSHGDAGLHDLREVSSPGLAKRGVKHGADVDDGVGGDELQEPSEGAADGGGHDDGAGRGDVGVGALLGDVEGGVVAGEGPDDG